MNTASHAPGRLVAYGCLALSMSLVGSYVALSKPLVAAFPVLLLAWLRFGIAALAMPHWLRRPPGEAPMTGRTRGLVFLESFLGNFLFSICMLFGVSLTSAVSAGVIMASIPAVVAIGSRVFLRESITTRVALAIACAALGIGLLALAQAVSMVLVFIIAGFASGSNLVHGATLNVVIAGGVFMILGYAFYCTAFAAAGSLVSRQSDVNSTIMPVQLPLILAYALSYTVIYSNGANAFYHVLGFLPPTAPIAMPVLYAAGDVPAWQVVIAAVLTAAGTVWMARIAVRIYSNSILRTGPRISFRQAIKESRSA